MSNYINLLKRALKDPELQGVDCIAPAYYPTLIRHLEKLPEKIYVSEWFYNFAGFYRCRHHNAVLGKELKQAFERGARGGCPQLTNVCSREELEKIIQEAEIGSE